MTTNLPDSIVSSESERDADASLLDVAKVFGLHYLLYFIFMLLYPNKILPPENVVTFVLLAEIVFLWLYQQLGYWPSLAELGITRSAFRSELKAGIVGGVLSRLLSLAVAMLCAFYVDFFLGIPVSTPNKQTAFTPKYLWGWVAHILLAVVLGPLAEEVKFRGVNYTWLRKKHGRWPALLLSSAVFALFHGLNPISFAQVFAAGLAFAFLLNEKDLSCPADCPWRL